MRRTAARQNGNERVLLSENALPVGEGRAGVVRVAVSQTSEASAVGLGLVAVKLYRGLACQHQVHVPKEEQAYGYAHAQGKHKSVAQSRFGREPTTAHTAHPLRVISAHLICGTSHPMQSEEMGECQ